MNKDAMDKAINLSEKLADDDKRVETLEKVLQDPLEGLRDNLISHIGYRISKIKENDDLKSIISNDLKERKKEASYKELMNLYELLENKSIYGTESLLNFFKADKSEKVPFLGDIDDRREEAGQKLYKELDSDTLQKIEKFIQVIDKVSTKKDK